MCVDHGSMWSCCRSGRSSHGKWHHRHWGWSRHGHNNGIGWMWDCDGSWVIRGQSEDGPGSCRNYILRLRRDNVRSEGSSGLGQPCKCSPGLVTKPPQQPVLSSLIFGGGRDHVPLRLVFTAWRTRRRKETRFVAGLADYTDGHTKRGKTEEHFQHCAKEEQGIDHVPSGSPTI